MVQIKLNTKSGKWEKIKNFISHMAQIKLGKNQTLK